MLGSIFNVRTVILGCMLASVCRTGLADSPIIRDAVGRTVGYYAGGYFTQASVFAVSATGYTFAVNGSGRVAAYAGPADGSQINPDVIYFDSTDCSGQAYVTAYNNFTGFVTRMNNSLVYAPKGVLSVDRTSRSRSNLGNCSATQSTLPLVPIFPNDEAVTGVPNTDFVPPIQVTIARDVHEVLRDGYESPAI